jgi:hypothetical protein
MIIRFRVKCAGDGYIILGVHDNGRQVVTHRFTSKERAYRACRTLNSEGVKTP